MKNTLPLSSFPLHGLLSVQIYYIPFVSVTMFLLLLYKTYNLPYTSGMSAQQGILLFIFAIMMMNRTNQGIGANKTQDSLKMVGFIFMTLAAIFFCIYFMLIQYYVMLVEIILFVILIVLNILELLFGFFSCWRFQSYEKQQ